MEFLMEFLPIIIYILLIIVIIVGIILGIKLIISIDKITKLVDDVYGKVKKVTPIFEAMGIVSDKLSGIITTVIGTIESLILKIFLRNKESEMESEDK